MREHFQHKVLRPASRTTGELEASCSWGDSRLVHLVLHRAQHVGAFALAQRPIVDRHTSG